MALAPTFITADIVAPAGDSATGQDSPAWNACDDATNLMGNGPLTWLPVLPIADWLQYRSPIVPHVPHGFRYRIGIEVPVR